MIAVRLNTRCGVYSILSTECLDNPFKEPVRARQRLGDRVLRTGLKRNRPCRAGSSAFGRIRTLGCFSMVLSDDDPRRR